MPDSSVRLGRNDPCYCGSGKKFKKCCLNKPPSPEEVAHQQVSAASEQLRNKILEFAANNFGEHLEQAWEDFNFGDVEGPIDPKDPENAVFIPFFLFLWDPEAPETTSDNIRGGIVARRFLLDNVSLLTEMERQLLHSYMTRPVSFYEVLSVDSGQGFSARDILANSNFEVRERLGTRDLAVGDILYAQLSPVGGITTMNFCAPWRVPPRMKSVVIELRQVLREVDGSRKSLSEQDLQAFMDDIREGYLGLRDRMMAPPVLVNTDGDPLEMHAMTFEVPSAQAAFDALASLALDVPLEALLHNAEYDDAGILSKVDFQWLKKGNQKFKSWDNTVLGKLRIEGRSLVAEANSEKRARKLRKEIEKRLGRSGAIYKGTEITMPGELLEQAKQAEPEMNRPGSGIEDESPTELELRQAADAFLQKELNTWPDKKLPVLGGKTPRQAIKDPDGREIVESLLLDMERGVGSKRASFARPNVAAIRKRLGLQLD